MTIAIPLFGSRVSPRFDHAHDMLLITVDGEKIAARERLSMGEQNPLTRVNWICQRGVDVVICGGISRFSLRSLTRRGLRVFPWVTGNIEEVIQLLLGGQLRSRLAVEPGGRCRRWRQRRKGQGAPWFLG
jgi:predicted Fe-Mo cluster-binding NifX family protein